MLLEIENLKVSISTPRGSVKAVRGVSFKVSESEILGIVGESGSGKSTAMNAVARLLPQNAEISADKILLSGVDLKSPDAETLYRIRGLEIAFIFQDPQAALNPVLKIGEQIFEALHVKNPNLEEDSAREKMIDLLLSVKIKSPEVWMDSYPHQLSGGMKQRVMVAMALANSPKLLVADEPTTSLDVTVQSEILQLLKEISAREKMAVVFITHDLEVASKLCDRILVMYGGRIAEVGETTQIVQSPRHPYTDLLWKSIPRIDEDITELAVIPGAVPSALSPPKGCPFSPRCPRAKENCFQDEPSLKDGAACFYPLNLLNRG